MKVYFFLTVLSLFVITQSWQLNLLQVARCTKIINADSEDPKYIINVKQFAKFVVDLADSVAPTDIEVCHIIFLL